MKNFLFAVLFLSAFPSITMAQTADVDTSGQTVSSSCVDLSNNMRYRARDVNTSGEVSTLQDFLNANGYLSSEPTGFFGLATVKAVKNFQSASGFSPTGYVGPLTRGKINAMTCGGSTTTTTTPVTINNTTTTNTAGLPAGCASAIGFSTTTGNRCLPATTIVMNPSANLPIGCVSTSGFSSVNGNACNGSTPHLMATVPSILVLSPSNGERIEVGKKYGVRWLTSNFPANVPVSITLLDEAGTFTKSNVSLNTSNDGSETWQVPANLSAGNYRIRVFCTSRDCVFANNQSVVEGKSAPFTVVATPLTAVLTPAITVVSPNGGEQFSTYCNGCNVQDNLRTTWTSSNISGNVYVYLNSSDGATCLLGSAPVSQGSFVATITNNYQCSNIARMITAGQYKILLNTDTNPANNVLGVHDSSDNYFTINAVATTTTSTQVIVPTVTSFTVEDSTTWPGYKRFAWATSNASSVDFIVDCMPGLSVSTMMLTSPFRCGGTQNGITPLEMFLKFINTTTAPITTTASIRAVGSVGYNPASKSVSITIPATQVPIISSVSPTQITAATTTTVTLYGSNFNSTLNIGLTGPGADTGVSPSYVSQDGKTMTFNFPLTITAPGTYSVQVLNFGVPTYSSINVTLVAPAPTTILSAPQITSVGTINDTLKSGQNNTVSWQAVSGATTYKIKIDSLSAQDIGNTTSWGFNVKAGLPTSLSTVGSHTINIEACNATVCSGWSSTVTVNVTAQ